MKSKLFCPYGAAEVQNPLGGAGEQDLRFGNAQDIPRGDDFGGQKANDVPQTTYTYRSK